jgi:SAM-dependent methyltransferase
MKDSLLPLLACPQCGGDLYLRETRRDGADIMDGSLTCNACSTTFAIRAGVPRFAEDITDVQERTAEAFGYEWNRYSSLEARYRQQFLDWIRPLEPGAFVGRNVLEGGCGKGRHTALSAEFGARNVVAIDLSSAVDAAFANTRHLPNAHIVQGDLNHPPVKQVFDLAYSIGVLHHLPDPERGFHALVSKLVPGGSMAAWVYGREGNGWIVHVVTPVREHVTARLPHRLLDTLAGALTVPLFAATRLVYGPMGNTSLGRKLPYQPYLTYIAPFDFREQRSIVFDHLVAPVAFYLRRDEFAGWFERAGLENVQINAHNANSWRGLGTVRQGNAA